MRLAVFLLYIFGSVPFILRGPFYGICLYTFFNLIRPEMLFWGSSRGSKVLLLLMATTLLGTLFTGRFDPSKLFRWQLLTILWIYLAVVVSILLSRYSITGQWTYVTELLKVYIVCYLLTALCESGKHTRVYMNVVTGATTWLALWGIDQYFRGNYRLEGLGGKAIGDSNYAAAHFVLMLPMFLSLMFAQRNWKWRGPYMFAAGVSVAAIFCTVSRGGLLGLVSSMFFYILTSPHRSRLIVFAMIVLVIASPLLTETFLERMSTMQSMETMDTSGQSRLALWRAGWYIFLEKPIFGCGFMAFPYEKVKHADKFRDTLDPEYIDKWIIPPKVTHSMIFQILSEGGIFLAIPNLVLFWFTLRRNRLVQTRYAHLKHVKEIQDYRNLIKGVSAGIFGFLVCHIFLDGLLGFFIYIQVAVSGVLRDQLVAAAEAHEKQGPTEAPEPEPQPGGMGFPAPALPMRRG